MALFPSKNQVQWELLKTFTYTSSQASSTFNLDVSNYSEVLIQGVQDNTSGSVSMASILYVPSEVNISSSSWCEYSWGWNGFVLYKNRISNYGIQWQYGYTKPDTANKIKVVILGRK